MPRTAQWAMPESSSVPDPVRLGQSGGSQPHRPAPLCASSQADYSPRADILIEESRQARAPGIPSGPSCHLLQSWRFWGAAEILGAQDCAGSWVQTRSLEDSGTPWDLEARGKGLFHCLRVLCCLHLSPGCLTWLLFLRQKEHTRKPITQPSAAKRGRKSPKQVWALGRNTA